MALHYEIEDGFEMGTDVIIYVPRLDGSFCDAEKISAELFYEFMLPGFKARRMPVWSRSMGDWVLSPISLNEAA